MYKYQISQTFFFCNPKSIKTPRLKSKLFPHNTKRKANIVYLISIHIGNIDKICILQISDPSSFKEHRIEERRQAKKKDEAHTARCENFKFFNFAFAEKKRNWGFGLFKKFSFHKEFLVCCVYAHKIFHS